MNWAFYESYNQLVKWLVGWNESVFGSFLTQFWWVNWLGIGGLVVMKRIFGIRVRGTKIRIRRESKVRFGFVLFCSSFRVSTCVRLKLLTCFVFFFPVVRELVGWLDNGSWLVAPVYLGELAMRCLLHLFFSFGARLDKLLNNHL